MPIIRQPHYDLTQRPFLVIWEATQACDLACRHCRASSQPHRHPEELTSDEARHLIDQVEAFGHPRPLFIITGGDPFKREDLFDLSAYASEKGLMPAVSPSGTPLLNRENLGHLKESGTRVISLSLDGSTPEFHDDFRRVPGSYQLTLDGWRAAQELGIKVQVNSTVTGHNLDDLPRLLELVREMGAMTWSVFFLVPTGRGQADDMISPQDHEAVMNFLYEASHMVSLKTTEGHHYKRVVLQRQALEERGLPPEDHLPLNHTYYRLRDGLAQVGRAPAVPAPQERMRRSPLHINAGDGFVFVSHRGEIYPSGYLPLAAGSVREAPLAEVYRESQIFRSLRDRSKLEGRCGRCEFNRVCGGSRSRAFAFTGNPLAEDPSCMYEPGSFPFGLETTPETREAS
ncbi:MAG: TIGR04053 family radical SAM/SPASM domain-containing protein [Anaerolineae bacterium]|nr:TIGR04053 family radical SAM/SPASM domain-containing protein [Anaerolineae bacterium]